MAELQSVTGSNVELINRKEEEIKKLEDDIASTQNRTKQVQSGLMTAESNVALSGKLQQRSLELQSVRDECRKLEEAIREEQLRKQEPNARIVKELQMEHEVYVQMIESLRQKIHEQRDAPPVQPPKTTDLQGEVVRLEAEIERVRQERRQKQEIAEATSKELREETKKFEEELQRVVAERQALNTEVDDLRRLPLEHEQLVDRKEQLARHITRQLTRINVWDQKIEILSEQASDIRQRAGLVSQVAPTTVNGSGSSVSSYAAAGLSEIVSQLNEKVQLAEKLEEQLQRDEDKANADLQAMLDEVTATQEKARQLKSGTKTTFDRVWAGDT